jgi:hypothetical protein
MAGLGSGVWWLVRVAGRRFRNRRHSSAAWGERTATRSVPIPNRDRFADIPVGEPQPTLNAPSSFDVGSSKLEVRSSPVWKSGEQAWKLAVVVSET